MCVTVSVYVKLKMTSGKAGVFRNKAENFLECKGYGHLHVVSRSICNWDSDLWLGNFFLYLQGFIGQKAISIVDPLILLLGVNSLKIHRLLDSILILVANALIGDTCVTTPWSVTEVQRLNWGQCQTVEVWKIDGPRSSVNCNSCAYTRVWPPPPNNHSHTIHRHIRTPLSFTYLQTYPCWTQQSHRASPREPPLQRWS